MQASINPAAWLAGQDIKAYIDARCGDDPLACGREALAMAHGDLLIACHQQEDLRAEIALAWLEREIMKAPTRALEMVRRAVEVLE